MKFNGEIHPVADLFPMLPDDELRDLAADIKTRGQLQPIVLDSDGRILDGRNRFAACKIAGVEPQFVTFDGDDAEGYALAVNIARRHMTKSQQAIVVAGALSKLDNQEDAGSRFGIAQSRISEAKIIRDWSADDDLAEAVLSRAKTFDKALADAKERRDNKLAQAKRHEFLRAQAPDLADAVDEETMTREEAEAALAQRKKDLERAERVAPIDVLVAESGARTYAERVESGEITWAEAEELAARWKREFDEAVERNVRRINEVAGGGWQALARMFREPDAAFNACVAEKLPDTAVKFIKEIRADVIDLANTWEGTK